MNSCVPPPEMPPGVLSSTPWPNSWATTSIEEIQAPAWFLPIWTCVPS